MAPKAQKRKFDSSSPSAAAANKAAKTEDPSPSPSQPENPAVAAHLVRVHEALVTVRGCHIFAGVQSKKPLTINEGGTMAPFCQKSLSLRC